LGSDISLYPVWIAKFRLQSMILPNKFQFFAFWQVKKRFLKTDRYSISSKMRFSDILRCFLPADLHFLPIWQVIV
jgi:hypothetical protein